MGNPIGRVPGPLGKPIRNVLSRLFDSATAYLRNLNLASIDDPSDVWSVATSLLDVDGIKEALRDIYASENWPGDDSAPASGNNRDPANVTLPSARRERDARRPGQPLVVRLVDPDWSVDHDKAQLSGQVSGTLVIPTPYGTMFDSPTSLRLTLNSVHGGAEDLKLGGTARAYKVVRADWKLRLQYDSRQLLRIAADAAKKQKLDKAAFEDLLRNVRFDFGAVIKAGIPLSWVKVSASSLLPSRRPLPGALDRLLPVQVAALPDSRMFMMGGVLLPKGVVFDTIVPGVGVHFSQYGALRGGSATVGGVTYPKLTELGAIGAPTSADKLGKLFPIFGYLDLKYAQRVSDSVDLGVGLTYAYSPMSGDSGQPDRPELHYLESRHKPWLPTSSENISPTDPTSKHRLMFTINGTF